MLEASQSKYKWYILAISTITGTFVSAMPFSCMPVLFKEISDDLGLDLVQIGTVWGIASLAGIFVSIIAGVLSDRFSGRMFLGVCCTLVGITGALRGLSNNFWTLSATVFINGIARLMVPISVTKTLGLWFRGKNLGMAMGTGAMGMGLGLMLGPMISATVLSPLLGGWENVLYLYGVISILVGILWFLFGREPEGIETTGGTRSATQLRQALSRLIRVKGLWLIGLTLLFRVGCLMGVTGYLPLYLRERGWAEASADGTLAAFYGISTVCVIPLSYLSDRLGSRKAILFPALVITIVCVSLLPVVDGGAVWAMMILAGIFMDGFMSLITTILLETEGVGAAYSGIAVGIVFTIVHFGSAISPPLGNSLASIGEAAPFIFWAFLSVVAVVTLSFIKETGWRAIKPAVTSVAD